MENNEQVELYKVLLTYYLPGASGYKWKTYEHTTTLEMQAQIQDLTKSDALAGALLVADMHGQVFTYSTQYLHAMQTGPVNAD